MKWVVWFLSAVICAATLVYLSGTDPMLLMSQAYDFITVNKLLLIVAAAVVIAFAFAGDAPTQGRLLDGAITDSERDDPAREIR